MPSAGGLAPGGMRTISPTSRRSVDIFSTLELERGDKYASSFSSLLSNEEVDDDDLVADCTRRASELLSFPRRVIALEAWCLLNASINFPGRSC